MALLDFLKPKWRRSVPAERLAGVQRLRNETTLKTLSQSDPDEGVRKAAVSRLESLREAARKRAAAQCAARIRPLLAQLRSSYIYTREVAIEELTAIGTPEAAAEALKVLDITVPTDWLGREFLLPGMLAKFGPSAVKPFCEALGTISPDLANNVAEALDEIKKSAGVSVETNLDTERYLAVKRRIQAGSEAPERPGKADLLRHKLAIQYIDGRKQAARELAAMGELRWQDLVQGDDGDFMRIAESNDPRTLEILVAGLDSGNVMDVVPAIARLGDAGTGHLLYTLERPTGKWDRCYILRSLGHGLTDRGFAAVSAILEDGATDEDVKVAAAAALERSADPRSTPVLERVARDSAQPYSVRKAAGDALAAHGSSVPLRFKREDWNLNAYVRAILQCASEGNTEEGTAQIYQQRALIREYGEEINQKSGFTGMQEVCQTIRNQLGPGGPARALEIVWDGIGEWRG